MASEATEEPWHFDKKVPIALIVTIVVQTVAVVWWASGIHHRVATVEAMHLVLASRTTAIEAASRTELSALRAELQARNERTLEGQRLLSEQIIEQRGDVKAIRATLERFERQLERADLFVLTRAGSARPRLHRTAHGGLLSL